MNNFEENIESCFYDYWLEKEFLGNLVYKEKIDIIDFKSENIRFIVEVLYLFNKGVMFSVYLIKKEKLRNIKKKKRI